MLSLDWSATLRIPAPRKGSHFILAVFGSHDTLDISEYEIACLETDQVSFYQRLGWELWRGALAGRKETELLPTPEQKGIQILRLPRTPPLDLDGSLVIEYAGRIW